MTAAAQNFMARDGGHPALENGSQEFDDFIYLISHDVRSSVRALLELPQWITEDLDEAGIKVEGQLASTIDLMNRHTGRLDRMLVDLLTYSRVGRMQSVQDVDIAAVLEDVLEGVKLPSGFNVVRALDCTSIKIGERDILTLLDALIQNAVKHHDQKKGQIIVASKRDGDAVVISVSDDGPGIKEEFREKVLAAMTTLRPRDELEGSGMGLAIVRKIARLYGGDARLLDSEYGRGSQVEVRLIG